MTQQKQEGAATRALLGYWRAALADSSLFHPDLPAPRQTIRIGQNDSGAWHITGAPAGWIEATMAASKSSKAGDDAAAKPIPFLLIPALLAPESIHGVKRSAGKAHGDLVPLCIPCMLASNGALSVDNERLPWIARRLLEPSYHDATVGTLADLDDFLTHLPAQPKTLTDTLRVAQQLFARVTGCRLASLPLPADDAPALPLLEIEGYGLVEGWFGLPYESPVPAKHLLRLYDQLEKTTAHLPLLATLAHPQERGARPPLALAQAASRYCSLVGHINRTHPLSPSQHQAMLEFMGLRDNAILAVNGPPGTGKTTLLQSIVAQEWVMAALNNAPCPIITAASTNVQAVENILDSFAKLGKETAHDRWLPDIGGFGLFLASATRDSEHPTYHGPAQHYFTQFETPEWVAGATTYYLNRAHGFKALQEKTRTVSEVVAGLRQRLLDYQQTLHKLTTQRYAIFALTESDPTVGAVTGIRRLVAACKRHIQACVQEAAQAQRALADCLAQKASEQAQHQCRLGDITRVELAWNSYLNSLPSFLLDLFSFIPGVKRRRNARDRMVLLANALTNALQHRDDGVAQHFTQLTRQEKLRTRAAAADIDQAEQAEKQRRDQANTKKSQLTRQMMAAETARNDWSALTNGCFPEIEDVCLLELNDQLDILIRAPMFQLANWYWSGCWLLEMDARLRSGAKDTKAPQKLEAMLRRFAKITPCMVSNFHMLPSFFCGWMGREIPMWQTIDLLLVDEAGQVAPEIGAPCCALAKRAVVVGDVHQIEPIWSVPEGIDRANAAKFGLTKRWDDNAYLTLEQDGYTAAKGSLMQMAARACEVQQYADTRGMMLTEHRRCVPELIAYCNELVYGGRLEPKRPSLPADRRLLPAFGYLALNGNDQPVGGSRRNQDDARNIVDWIVQHRSRLEHHYRDPHSGQPTHISRIIGIVTPFAAQARAIAALIRQRMPDTRTKECGITVGTVHRLQGAEREIVLFSPVYGDGHTGDMFFDHGRNMMNVAVSRAKDSFLVFGNLALFAAKKGDSPSAILAKYLFQHADNDLARHPDGWSSQATSRPVPLAPTPHV